MKTRASDLLLTGAAPAIWGTTYIVATEFLPTYPAITVALLRALPAGLVLLLITRQLPTGIWWMRVLALGALNFSIFLSLLFVSAYRLPGGIAATVSSVQPLLVVLLAHLVLATPVRSGSVVAALLGAAGVALMVWTTSAELDAIGVLAGLAAAGSMALGTVLTRKWQPPVSLLTFTAWQLTAGGILLLPLVLVLEPAIPVPTLAQLAALAWLGLLGMALAYVVWLRGVARLDTSVASSLLLLSPLTAVVLGWLVLGQALGAAQIAGAVLIVGSIWLGQWAVAGRLSFGLQDPQSSRTSQEISCVIGPDGHNIEVVCNEPEA